MPELGQLLVGLTGALSSVLSFLPSDVSQVTAGPAIYQGKIDSHRGVVNYYGIPYAEPPVGERRWHKPERKVAAGLFDATQPSPGCPVGTAYWSILPQPATNVSEDCLRLNIQTPIAGHHNVVSSNSSGQNLLPVLVNIHGGGYLGGDSDTKGTHLVTHGNIVYVSINYRLGLLGFLGGDEVMSNGTLNAGLLDQRMALEWVRDNIAHFGGDPDKITIYGDSAGGGSVSYQLTAFGGEGDAPFAHAYAACPWWTPVWTPESQNLAYKTVLETANCSNIACLRAFSESEIIALSVKVQKALHSQPQNGYGLFSFSPVIDGSFVKSHLSEAFKSGSFHKVPIIVDHSPNEGLAFTSYLLLDPDEKRGLEATILDFGHKYPQATQELVQAFFGNLYPIEGYANVFSHRATWFADILINCPTQMIAQYVSDVGVPVYKMLFSTGTTLHGAPQPYYFSSEVNTTVLKQEISLDLTSYLLSFIHTGDPNSQKRTLASEWPRYLDSGRFNVLEIHTQFSEVVVDNDANERCSFIKDNAHIFTT